MKSTVSLSAKSERFEAKAEQLVAKLERFAAYHQRVSMFSLKCILAEFDALRVIIGGFKKNPPSRSSWNGLAASLSVVLIAINIHIVRIF